MKWVDNFLTLIMGSTQFGNFHVSLAAAIDKVYILISVVTSRIFVETQPSRSAMYASPTSGRSLSTFEVNRSTARMKVLMHPHSSSANRPLSAAPAVNWKELGSEGAR